MSRVLPVRTAARVMVLPVAGESVSCSTARKQGCLFLHPKVENANLLLSCSLPGDSPEESTQAVHQQHCYQSNSAPSEELAFLRGAGGLILGSRKTILLQAMAGAPAGTRYLSVLHDLASTVNASLAK